MFASCENHPASLPRSGQLRQVLHSANCVLVLWLVADRSDSIVTCIIFDGHKEAAEQKVGEEDYDYSTYVRICVII